MGLERERVLLMMGMERRVLLHRAKFPLACLRVSVVDLVSTYVIYINTPDHLLQLPVVGPHTLAVVLHQASLGSPRGKVQQYSLETLLAWPL
jgi:hypothetical protein